MAKPFAKTANPRQQGLKPDLGFKAQRDRQAKTANPRQQGLKREAVYLSGLTIS